MVSYGPAGLCAAILSVILRRLQPGSTPLADGDGIALIPGERRSGRGSKGIGPGRDAGRVREIRQLRVGLPVAVRRPDADGGRPARPNSSEIDCDRRQRIAVLTAARRECLSPILVQESSIAGGLPQGADHLHVLRRDVDGALEFYCQLLGGGGRPVPGVLLLVAVAHRPSGLGPGVQSRSRRNSVHAVVVARRAGIRVFKVDEIAGARVQRGICRSGEGLVAGAGDRSGERVQSRPGIAVTPHGVDAHPGRDVGALIDADLELQRLQGVSARVRSRRELLGLDVGIARIYVPDRVRVGAHAAEVADKGDGCRLCRRGEQGGHAHEEQRGRDGPPRGQRRQPATDTPATITTGNVHRQPPGFTGDNWGRWPASSRSD